MKKNLFLLTALSMLLMTSQGYSADGCCCESCVCPPGPQGFLGAQGIQGIVGSTGAQGPIGPIGPAGPQGPCCPRSATATVAGLYSIVDQQIPPGNPVLFESASVITAGAFDISLMPTTGQITFLNSGIYSITWRVSGELTPPYPEPVPVWSLALFLDGIPVAGSCFAGFSLFPALLASNGASNVIIMVTAGQVLTLQNSSLLPISLLSSIPGSSLPQISASLSITQE